MDSRVQAYLDGEIQLDELPPELRSQAEAWDDLLGEVRQTAPAGAPLGLHSRILAGIEGRTPARNLPAWLEWLVRPRPITVSPLAAAAAAAVLLLVIARPWSWSGDDAGEVVGEVYVQFVVDAPTAETVHLAGDFNDWLPTVALNDPDGDGVWSGRVALEPGVHEYMFIIDGSDWITDPNAASFQDDGFGRRNAVLAVTSLNGT